MYELDIKMKLPKIKTLNIKLTDIKLISSRVFKIKSANVHFKDIGLILEFIQFSEYPDGTIIMHLPGSVNMESSYKLELEKIIKEKIEKLNIPNEI